tara:strand:- start:925 stop:2223 length:1299 start_codon:yes stop_codon:yes gene_type:complete
MSRLSRPTSPLVENYDYFYNDLTEYLNNELKSYRELNDKMSNRESVENVIETLHSILTLGKLRTHYILLIHEYENSNLNSFLDKNKSVKLKESKDKITELRNLLMNSQNNEKLGRYTDEERYDEVVKTIKELIKNLSKNVEYIHKVFYLNQEKLRLNNSLVDSFNEIEYLKEEEKILISSLEEYYNGLADKLNNNTTFDEMVNDDDEEIIQRLLEINDIYQIYLLEEDETTKNHTGNIKLINKIDSDINHDYNFFKKAVRILESFLDNQKKFTVIFQKLHDFRVKLEEMKNDNTHSEILLSLYKSKENLKTMANHFMKKIFAKSLYRRSPYKIVVQKPRDPVPIHVASSTESIPIPGKPLPKPPGVYSDDKYFTRLTFKGGRKNSLKIKKSKKFNKSHEQINSNKSNNFPFVKKSKKSKKSIKSNKSNKLNK